VIAAVSCIGFAQGGASSTLTGVVVDETGAVIPGVEVIVRNDNTGAEYKAITSENGTFSIPALTAGTYTATASMANFKQSVTRNIVLVVGVTSNVRIQLQVGGRTEVIEVTAGAEIVQSTTASVASTLSTTQLMNLPLTTRNSLDFMIFLPGANTTGNARDTRFMGLPGAFINITVDGIDTTDNYNSNSDGFYSMITARPDSMQEVTMATAGAGADSSGGGMLQIKFVTRSGNNEYHGSLYDYERNVAMNSNYWFNNRDQNPVYQGSGQGRGLPCTAQQMLSEWENCKAPRGRVILHQAGGRIGGPIVIPKLFNGKDRAFFFVNMEKFLMPSSYVRNNTIYAPETEQGIYSYVYKQSGQPDVVKTANLWTIAQAAGHVATVDPNVKKLLADVRSAVAKEGTITPYPVGTTNPLYRSHIYEAKGIEVRNYITTRFDVNLARNHRVEASFNGENRKREPDNVNTAAARYPGMPNYGNNQGNRGAVSFALRSTITPRMVNEARFGWTMGTTLWYANVPTTIASGANGIGDLGGFFWNPSGMSSISIITNTERRGAPNKTFEDTLSWSKGTHNLSFGWKLQHISAWRYTQVFAPSLTFGIPSAYDPGYVMFDAINGPKNFPDATSDQRSAAATLYASLTARITNISGTAYRDETTGDYANFGPANRRSRQRMMGLFAQDSWRMHPSLSLNLGLRWEVNFPWTPMNKGYSWATPENVWGPSGVNSFFKPCYQAGEANVRAEYKPCGTGAKSEVYQYEPGSPAYNVDYKAFAPTIGFAWSPRAQGFLGKIVGGGSQTVLRGSFSISYNNYDAGTYDGRFFSNPGGQVSTARSQSLNNLILPGMSYPVLFRDRATNPQLLDPAPFPKAPTFPLQVTIANSINAFEPDIRTPYTMSWSFGIQREITKDMMVEVRYMAQRSKQNWFVQDLNEANLEENGWIDEFRRAQGNLYANMAAGKGKTFRYDSTVSGTQPLPIILAHLGGKLDPTVSSNYTSAVLGSTPAAVFINSTYVDNYLSKYNPNARSLASVFYGDTARRANAVAAGLPVNLFTVNPGVGSAYTYKNGGGSQYDAMVVELRRRMAKGLLVQANYTWAKAFSQTFLSWRRPWAKDLQGILPHALKMNWVYQLPFGKGRMLFSGSGRVLDRIIGDWELEGTGRIQSGNIWDFGSVVLVGMSDQELSDSIGLYTDDANKRVWYIPKDIRDQSYYAYQYNAGGFTSGAPFGRYIAPAGTGKGGNCITIASGDCAPRHHYIHGPMFMRFDIGLVKRIRFTESKSFELRGEFLNAFNNINFNSYSSLSGSSLNMGLIDGAFTDNSNSQDPGGRLIQIVLRLNF
jgi:hypothetical protein